MLDERGIRNLQGIHPTLRLAVTRAQEKDPRRRTIIDGGGVRTRAQAASNAERKTGVPESLHLIQPSGFGHAVDVLATQINGRPLWDVTEAREINDGILAEADALDFPLQEGSDWNLNGIHYEKGEWDAHHLQIPQPWKLEIARAAMRRRQLERLRA